MSERRIVLALLGTFAAAALVLASLGVYGVMAYAVATRRREFGIRLACGALRGDVMREVLRRGALVTSIGLILGLAGAASAARLIASQLYQVGTSDPIVAATTTVTVMAAALAACWLPAWRASTDRSARAAGRALARNLPANQPPLKLRPKSETTESRMSLPRRSAKREGECFPPSGGSARDPGGCIRRLRLKQRSEPPGEARAQRRDGE